MPATETSTTYESDIDYLVNALKEKLSVTNSKQEKLKLLSLAPKSWTIEKKKCLSLMWVAILLGVQEIFEKSVGFYQMQDQLS